ncbi:MAG: cation transporter [Bacteroidetes bacterium GWF2_42_66]|nr:MAG: cation transporter [Bacteroidetes bacterium GWA2_42_15]OFY02836.1 MAG: cation transporter [Bacteroidetes bacterium GWE2_42_39]OFY44490.1 MAG: cation transporter [Bacteroidetes bacterium GWF2_42_66]HBL74964.1 cation transporter [Prolixibacteraceae bacterium]HCR89275.1 cation transporter [Prolixibacteraceae bacterium]
MEKEKNRVALLSVFAAIFLTGFKIIIGILTGSLGILSEALHSGLDLVAAVITYFSVRVSDKPADRQHNYGHGKIENLSAFIETVLLLVTCVWIVYEAITRLVSGNTHIEVTVWSYIVVVSSIIVDFSRSRVLYKVAKKYNSQALEADALHFSTDIWSSSVVLFGLICANFGFFFADSVAALAVALIVFFVSYRLGKKSIDVLLDKAPQESVELVKSILTEFSEVKDFHGLKIRTAGADTFVKINVHLDPDLSLLQVHEICDKIEKEIGSRIKRSEVYIHAEPQDINHIQNEEKDNL